VKKHALVFLPFLFLGTFSFAQSNDVIDAYLEKELADYEITVYLLMTASGQLPDDLTPSVAVATLDENLGIDSSEKRNQPINFGDFSFILMETFDLPGGIFYGLFPGIRYAVREVNYKAFFAVTKKATEQLTPFEVLQAIGLALDYKEALQ
jgi:hypothetical protein